MENRDRPTRRHRVLLGFMLKAELDAVLRQTSFALTDPNAKAADVWRISREARGRLDPLAGANIEPLPVELEEPARLVRERSSYRLHYERVAEYEFGLAPIDALLTPQFSADTDYVDELASLLENDPSPSAVFDFSMPSGRLTPPIISANTVIFSSSRLDLFASPIPLVRPTDQGGYEITVEAQSRPNLLQVAVYKDRLILTNGVHKALALQRKGITTIPCVWRKVNAIDEVGLPQAGFEMFKMPVLEGSRPALVADFLNEAVSPTFVQPATNQVLRLAINVESFSVPLPFTAAAPVGQETS